MIELPPATVAPAAVERDPRRANDWAVPGVMPQPRATPADETCPPPPAADWGRLYTECRQAMFDALLECLRKAEHSPIRESDCEDLVHEVFADLMRDPPRTTADWRAYLVAAVIQRMTDETGRTVEEAVTESDRIEDPSLLAERRMHAEEIRSRVLRIMGYMTPRQQQIARLRLFEGRSVGQIAEAMATSSSNISQIVIRCLAKLQPVLVQLESIDDADVEAVRPPRRTP